MKSLFSVVVLLLVGIVGLGFYQGWFHFSTDSTERTSSATVTVDQYKIRADEDKAKKKVEEFRQNTKEQTDDRTGKVQESERRP